jgi:SWI/SNF-related matrix-associated actin-dependent regulator 1 of chromatin subfamily A
MENLFAGTAIMDNPEPLTKKTPKKTAALSVDKNSIIIQFDFDWDTVALVKSLPNRRFHNEGKKYWSCPISAEAIETLAGAGFEIDKELITLTEKTKITVDDVQGIEVPGLKRELFPFQKQGVSFIEQKQGRALIADEMGLGKTIQALAWLHLHPEKKPVVIICPASLKLNWAQEIEKTLPGKQNVQILFGGKPEPLWGDIIILNYDILHKGWLEPLIAIKPQVLICDEAHAIKSSKTLRTKAVKKLAKGIPHVLALTGTPIVNRPIEGFNIIQLVNQSIFPNWFEYTRRYCGAQQTRFGWDVSGATNTDELHERLKTVMIRHKKADVLQDLPAKLYSYIPMEIDNGEEYHKAETTFIQYLRETKGEAAARKASNAEHLAQIEALKQICVRGKMNQAIAWIKDFFETADEKLVVFAVHKETVDRLMAEFKDIAVKIDGSVTTDARDAAVKAFQNDPSTRLFVGNIQAAGIGLTLTAASSVAFLELDWVVGRHLQAEDRCHRIGQKNTVNIYYLLAANTIEQEIMTILSKKAKVIQAVLDGGKEDDITVFTELMKSYEF